MADVVVEMGGIGTVGGDRVHVHVEDRCRRSGTRRIRCRFPRAPRAGPPRRPTRRRARGVRPAGASGRACGARGGGSADASGRATSALAVTWPSRVRAGQGVGRAEDEIPDPGERGALAIVGDRRFEGVQRGEERGGARSHGGILHEEGFVIGGGSVILSAAKDLLRSRSASAVFAPSPRPSPGGRGRRGLEHSAGVERIDCCPHGSGWSERFPWRRRRRGNFTSH